MPTFQFRISQNSRLIYDFKDDLFSLDGHLLIADFTAARRFAAEMSRIRGKVVPASDIFALGLIHEFLHLLIRYYEMNNPACLTKALESMGTSVSQVMQAFTIAFPPGELYRNSMDSGYFLNVDIDGRSNRVATLEELLIHHITIQNPAVEPYRDLFMDESLDRLDAYRQLISRLLTFFSSQPAFPANGKDQQSQGSLIDVLISPCQASPHSLLTQLEYLVSRWGHLLDKGLLNQFLRGIDFAKEEAIRGDFSGGFAGESPVLNFSDFENNEYERFSLDKEWMPRLILLAKNSYVWLDQLSKKYQRSINHLDHIPDDELDLIKQRGITGLWLIGVWERSTASQRIKQMMGQADAIASAYSINDYQIAADLGGWEAMQNLRWRAWQRGIRLSADMVPNHMGIDSLWVMEHPDWFLSLPNSPYSNYSFNGPDLSSNSRVRIQIEDHYYDKTDAAVVFKRTEQETGATRYIYHGNDGTSMPWNDTAQLNFTRKDVHEAVIQTILHVARNFPIIRFDAAMTLAKKHVQRLWFPEAGTGGAIPTRSEHGMTRADFDRLLPEEFWREVVDRVTAEVPDTLLLAEAFWLMEGYFVRTLGMHRVYNSAFMHMLRDEDNAKYRQLIKNTLEFDPQVLKRYVNFMNNPDEKSAAEQFGTTEKYFGVCTMLVTLPGLPMFGHGQLEGYREKYGMEYHHPKWEEQIDEGLVRCHDWRIFPLIHRRAIFANVEDFRFYDFISRGASASVQNGGVDVRVNEDVFAYSNRVGNERALVIYHNKYDLAHGWLRKSVSYKEKGGTKLSRIILAEALSLPQNGYAIFKDFVTGLEYIRSCRDLYEHGLYLELSKYQCHVFLDWRFVSADDERWPEVCHFLNGIGIPSIQAKYDELTVKQNNDGKKRRTKVGENEPIKINVKKRIGTKRPPKMPEKGKRMPPAKTRIKKRPSGEVGKKRLKE